MTTSRRQKDSIFERAQCAMFLVDEQGHVLQANRRAVDLTGFSRRQLEESAINSVVHPLEWDEVWSHLLEIGSNSHRVRFNGSLVSRRGNPIQVEIFARLYQPTRGPVSALVRARDTREESLLKDRLKERIRRTSVSQERERRRMARALHDGTLHSLMDTMSKLDLAIAHVGETQMRLQLQDVRSSLEDTLGSMRALVGHLRADELESGDLASALDGLLCEARTAGIKTQLVTPSAPGNMNKHARTMAYRIAQEVVRNVIRHSHATTLTAVMECDDERMSLSFTDDGVGFSAPSSETEAAAAGAMGLQGAFERASILGGRLSIESGPGKGTRVTLFAPASVICEKAPDIHPD